MMGFLTAYRAAVEMCKIADETVSPVSPALGGAPTIRRGAIDDRGSRAATTAMLVMASMPADAGGVVCDAKTRGCSRFPESSCAGRMTATAIVIAVMTMPANPNATRGVRA